MRKYFNTLKSGNKMIGQNFGLFAAKRPVFDSLS